MDSCVGRIRALPFGVLLVALASGLGTRPADATVVRPQSLETLTAKAARVVRGRVASQRSGWDRDHRRIYTWTELEVTETWAGEDSDAVVVKALGGIVDDVGMNVSGTPQFAVGEDVVLFLRPSKRDVGVFVVVGLSQGKYRLEGDTAFPDAAGLAFVRTAPGNPQVGVLPVLSIRDLRETVRRLSASTAPEVPEVPATPPTPAVPQTPLVPPTLPPSPTPTPAPTDVE